MEESFAWFVRRFYLEGFGLESLAGPPHRHLPPPRGAGGSGLPHQDLLQVFADGNIDLDLRLRQPANEEEELHRISSGASTPSAKEYEGQHPRHGRHRLLPGRHRTGRPYRLQHPGHQPPFHHATGPAQLREPGGRLHRPGRHRRRAQEGRDHHRPGTITYRRDAVAIIIASGEAKAPIVAAALEHPPGILDPASCLQSAAQRALLLTAGTASRLKARRMAAMRAARPARAATGSGTCSSSTAVSPRRARPWMPRTQALLSADGAGMGSGEGDYRPGHPVPEWCVTCPPPSRPG